MTRRTGFIGALLALLLTASGVVATTASVATATAIGTIAGRVLIGPTCPVVNPDNPCADRPLVGAKVVLLRGGAAVASRVTDARGRFWFHPWRGHLVVAARSATPGYAAQARAPVVVHGGHTTRVTLHLDSGIR